MKDKIDLNKDDIEVLIENQLYELIVVAIENEYNIDKFNNFVYKEGGRNRAVEKIKNAISLWEQKYNFPQNEIIEVIRKIFKTTESKCKEQRNEITKILEEIEVEEQIKKDIAEGNIEKYERNI